MTTRRFSMFLATLAVPLLVTDLATAQQYRNQGDSQQYRDTRSYRAARDYGYQRQDDSGRYSQDRYQQQQGSNRYSQQRDSDGSSRQQDRYSQQQDSGHYSQQQDRYSQQDRRSYSADRADRGRSQRGQNDRLIANWLAGLNKVEIQLAQFADDRAELDDVQQFASEIADDHRRILEKLEQFAPQAAQMDSNAADRSRRERGEQSRASGHFDHMAVLHQISEQTARRSRQELQRHEGLDFDWAFVGQQAVMHQQSHIIHDVLRQYASEDLREVIDEAIEGIEQHQQELEDLMNQLERREAQRHRQQG